MRKVIKLESVDISGLMIYSNIQDQIAVLYYTSHLFFAVIDSQNEKHEVLWTQ